MKFGPKSLQNDLLKRHIGPFLFVFLTIMFLLLMQFLMLYLDKIVGKGLPLTVILELILTNLAYMVVLAVPMAVLVASLMVYGSFSESNEFTAVKAAGIHPFKIITPLLIAGGVLFIALVLFSNYILPEANYRARALFIDIRMKKPGFDLKEGVFYDGIEGYTFLVSSIPPESDSLYKISLFQEARDGKDEALIKAEKGRLSTIPTTENLNLILFNGEIFRTILNRSTGKETIEKTAFNSYSINFDLSKLEFSRSNPESRGRNDRTMRAEAMFEVIQTLKTEIENENKSSYEQNRAGTFKFPQFANSRQGSDSLNSRTDSVLYSQTRPRNEQTPPRISKFIALNNLPAFETQREVMRTSIRGIRTRSVNYDGVKNTLKWKNERLSKYWVEIHKKVAIPIGCILFVFIGAPLGLLTKKGNLGIAAVFAAIIFTFYWIGLIQGEKLADRLIVSPFVGMWFINFVFAIIAVFLNIKIIRNRFF